MHATTTLPRPLSLAELLDFDALTGTPRDVLRRAEHELAHEIQIAMGLRTDAEIANDETINADLARLAALREELAERDAKDPEIRLLLHAHLRHELAA